MAAIAPRISNPPGTGDRVRAEILPARMEAMRERFAALPPSRRDALARVSDVLQAEWPERHRMHVGWKSAAGDCNVEWVRIDRATGSVARECGAVLDGPDRAEADLARRDILGIARLAHSELDDGNGLAAEQAALGEFVAETAGLVPHGPAACGSGPRG